MATSDIVALQAASLVIVSVLLSVQNKRLLSVQDYDSLSQSLCMVSVQDYDWLS